MWPRAGGRERAPWAPSPRGWYHWLWPHPLSPDRVPALCPCRRKDVPCPNSHSEDGRAGACSRHALSGALERPVCGDGSSRGRIPAENTLSSGGIESSLRSGKKPQLITSVK